jgi:transcriptional regulator with XRE-family HTH domain
MTDNGQDRMTLGSHLRRRQVTLKLKQREAAELCGVTPSVYSRWLAELTLPSMANLGGVAEFLGISRDELLLMLPENYQMRTASSAEVVALREELAELRSLNTKTSRQLARLTETVNRLAAVIEQLTPTA